MDFYLEKAMYKGIIHGLFRRISKIEYLQLMKFIKKTGKNYVRKSLVSYIKNKISKVKFK